MVARSTSRNRNGTDRLATRVIPAPAPLPPTERGRRTREQLVEAARHVFERRGYLDARISDIAAQANVAHGTFYSYFATKEAIFLAVMDTVTTSLYESAVVVTGESDPVLRIEQSIRQYLRAWQADAAMMGIVYQVTMYNPDARRHLQASAVGKFRARMERGIRRMQRAGVADASVNPTYMAQALSVMTANMCYELFVLRTRYDEDEAVRTLTTIWTRSIGLTGPAR